jgi:hypothetical protein
MKMAKKGNVIRNQLVVAAMTIVVTALVFNQFTTELFTIITTTTAATSGHDEPESRPIDPPSTSNKMDPSLFYVNMTDYHGPARAYPRFPYWNTETSTPFPCFVTSGRLMRLNPAKHGLLFQRPHKVGSTTLSGMVMRLAHKYAPLQPKTAWPPYTLQRNETPWCEHRSMHGSAVAYQYALRKRNHQSFLFSILRNPNRRMISYFFHFQVSAYQVVPTDANFRRLLLHHPRDALLQDLSMTLFNRSTDVVNHTHLVEAVINDYDFIAILERFDESLVALKMILNLSFDDILYVKDRSEGTFTNGFKSRPCMYLVPR